MVTVPENDPQGENHISFDNSSNALWLMMS